MRSGRVVAAVLLLGCLFGAQPQTAHAQVAGEPLEYARALGLLQEGDTAGALQQLRAVTAAHPRFGPAFLRLGAVLVAGVVVESPGLNPALLEAERALRRALDLLGRDPEVLVEYGQLLYKRVADARGGRTDAFRFFDEAINLVEQRGDAIPPEMILWTYDRVARVYEDRWARMQNSVVTGMVEGQVITQSAGGLASITTTGSRRPNLRPPGCEVLTARAAATVCPEDSDAAERARMMRYFRAALALDSSNVDVAIRLLGHLADEENWAEYHRLADRITDLAPHDPRAFLLRGLGLHHVGRSDLADSVFRIAKELLPPVELERIRDIGSLLPPAAREEYASLGPAGRREVERIFFTIADPMYLTEVEERRIEHYSRVAWADLKFGNSAMRLRGADTDRGGIFVRYGAPDAWEHKRPWLSEGSGSPADLPQHLWMLSHRLKPGELPGMTTFTLTFFPPGPRFGQFTGHAMNDPSRRLGRLENELPEFYRPRMITNVASYLHQFARFRGDDADRVRIEVYALPPLRELGVGAGGGLDAGMFLHDRDWRLVWHDKQSVEVRDDRLLRTSYRIEVNPGRYYYTVEARASGPDTVPRPLARTRLGVGLEAYPRDEVSLSDLLLAEEIAPRVAVVSRRDELVISPSRTLVFRPGQPVHVYFEVYGLASDEDGWGRYRAELLLKDSTAPDAGFVERLSRGDQELFRSETDPATTLHWERAVAVPEADDRIPEYLKIELPRRNGPYRLEIRITDLISGKAAASSRTFIVFSPGQAATAPPAGEEGANLRHGRQ